MELYDKIADLALLWRRTAEIFPRFEEVKCDWDQAFYDFLPRLAGTDDAQTHLLFAEFMNLLGDGHTEYQFPRAFLKENGFLPFSLRYCGNAYFVDGTLPGQEDRLGAVVEKIDGRPFSDVLDEAASEWVASPAAARKGAYIGNLQGHISFPIVAGKNRAAFRRKKAEI